MKHISFLAAIIASSLGTSYGAGLVTDFDSNTFGTDLAGQGLWTITGATESGVSFVNSSPFLGGSGVNAGQLGFQEISGTTAVLSHPVSLGVNGSSFSVTTIIQDSNSTFPNRDQFGFSLQGASGEIFGINLSPTTQVANPNGAAVPRLDNVSWSSLTTGNSAAFAVLSEIQSTTFDVVFTTLDPNNLQFSISSVGLPLITETISTAGIGNETFTRLDIYWTPLDADDEGSNSIFFDDLSFVPEPSTALLGAFGVLGLLRRRRA